MKKRLIIKHHFHGDEPFKHWNKLLIIDLESKIRIIKLAGNGN